MLEHVAHSLPQQGQIFFRKAGLLCQSRRNEAVCNIKPVRDGIFAPHGSIVAALLFGLCFSCNRHARNGMLKRHNRIDRTGESKLHRSTNLTGIRACCHHGAERPDVKIICAHLLACLVNFASLSLTGLIALLSISRIGWCFFEIDIQFCVCRINFFVQNCFFFHEDVIANAVALRQLDVVAHLALQADIGDKALPCFGIDARQIACVRVAIRIAVFHIKDKHEVISVFDFAHCYLFSCWWLVKLFDILLFKEGLPLMIIPDGKLPLIIKRQMRREPRDAANDFLKQLL